MPEKPIDLADHVFLYMEDHPGQIFLAALVGLAAFLAPFVL